ncbi:hypothetical protein [Dactylosporangium sp. CA-233914]|uniref:hypothetical protein n=1 Tax=Dactylosporangium sp. CA-233914 TaxID=3239934 RepID=UPI003D933072
MLAVARWVLIGICLLIVIPLLTSRGGLGEYARGGSLTTAHLDTCFENVDRLERPHIACSARWSTGAREVRGAVTEVDPTGAKAVTGGGSGSHYEVRVPATDVRVFAHGTDARPADATAMAAGAGFLLATLALLAWETVTLVRRFTARRSLHHRPATRTDDLEPAV